MNNPVNSQMEMERWSKLYGKPISEEEYKEICHNLHDFFTTLKEWADEEGRKKDEEKQCISHQRPL